MSSGNQEAATVLINKLAAAQRQLDAAIRMAFAGEDELAIATVASAAYGILRDLSIQSGQHPFEIQLRDGVVAIAADLVRGKLREDDIKLYRQSEEFWKIIEHTASLIRALGPDKTFSELCSVLDVRLPDPDSFSRKENRGANFLKHADLDPKGLLPIASLDNEALLQKACGVYLQIAGGLTSDMTVWMSYCFVTHGITTSPHPTVAATMRILAPLSPDERQTMALAMVLERKRSDGVHSPENKT